MGVQASSTSNRSADRVTPLCTVGPRPNRRLASKHPSSSVDLSLDPDELEAAASQYMNLQNMCHAISRVEDNPPASRALVQSGDSKCTSRNNPGNERIDLPTSLMPIVWQRGQLLGAGSYGRVYFGLNMSTGELMAVKQIRYTPGHPTDATRQAALALQREVRCLQALQHPNIVRYLGVERDDVDGIISICLEYCAGGSIASLLEKFGPFNEALTRSYMRMILAGLTFLHTRPAGGILHRDIKGANVLVDSDGICKLADFGASKQIQQDLLSLTDGCRSLRGTPYWMAPEVIKQIGHGRPADVWSLGCTMVEMLTAKPPWSHFTSQISALFHIASSKSPPPLPPNLSPAAASFILRMLVRDPRERADAAELADHAFLATGDQAQRAPFSQETGSDTTMPAQHSHPCRRLYCTDFRWSQSAREMPLSRKWQRAPLMFSALFLAAGALQTSSRLAAAYELPCRTSHQVHASQPIDLVSWSQRTQAFTHHLPTTARSIPLPCSAHAGADRGIDCSSSIGAISGRPAQTVDVSVSYDSGQNPYVAAAMAAAARRSQSVSLPAPQPLPRPPTVLSNPRISPASSASHCEDATQGPCIRGTISATQKGKRCGSVHEKVATSASATEEDASEEERLVIATEDASEEARLMHQQRERLLEEKAKKKILWEQELQKELEYQRYIKATRDTNRRSSFGGERIYPDG